MTPGPAAGGTDPVVLRAKGSLALGSKGSSFQAMTGHYILKDVFFHRGMIDALVTSGLTALSDGARLADVCIPCLLCAPPASSPVDFCLTYAHFGKGQAMVAILPRADWFTNKLAKGCVDTVASAGKTLPPFFQ